MSKRQVTIMGRGNGARTMAADMTLSAHAVTLFEFEQFHDSVKAIFESGLVCWCQFCEMFGTRTPLMRATIELGVAVSGVDYWKTGRTLQRCGIADMTAEQLCQYGHCCVTALPE